MSNTEISLPISPPQPAAPNTIFRGPNGIRAGWRVLIFLILTIAVGLLMVAPFALIRALHIGSPAQNGVAISGITPLCREQ